MDILSLKKSIRKENPFRFSFYPYRYTMNYTLFWMQDPILRKVQLFFS